MSKVIDEKIVSLELQNQNFERNAKASLGTLEKLKQSLLFKGASSGLEAVTTSAAKLNSNGLSLLGNSVDAIKVKFSVLEVMAMTALSNITNRAIATGEKMVKALTIDPIKSGFEEYETQMGAVQTILSNTQKEGTNVKMVNAALDELNQYADKTIYNFTEMTRNIGTFTAAGVKLNTSVSAIKGISNLAAISGSTSQQASTAMYQLSQAIASGTVKLMDWNSVVNAGMGGQVFQDALIRTSQHLKTGAKAAIKAKGSFRESLQTGWLTTEVLTQTLDQFATAADTQEEYQAAVEKFVKQGYSKEEATQMADMARNAGDAATKVKTFSQLIDTLKEALGSGWTTTWRTIIGDFEEARNLWTNVSDVLSDAINKSADARNKVIGEWAKLGGRADLIEGFSNIFKGLVDVITPIKEAFRDIFPPATGEQLYKITENFKKLTAQFKISEKTASNIKDTFRGVFGVIKIGVDVLGAIGKVFMGVVKGALSLGGAFTKITAPIGNFFGELAEGLDQSNAFSRAADGVINTLSNLVKAVSNFGGPALQALGKGIKTVIDSMAEAISSIGKGLGDILKGGGLNSLLDAVNSGIFATILLKIKKFIAEFTGSLTDDKNTIFGKLKESISGLCDVLDSVRGSLEVWQANLKVGILLKIASAVAILTVSLISLSSIDKTKLTDSLGAITMLFIELMGAMKIAASFGEKGFAGIGQSISAITLMVGMSSSILILSSALKKLSNIDADHIASSLVALGGVFAELIIAIKLMNGQVAFSPGTAFSLLKFASTMLILGEAVEKLSALSWDEIGRGLSAIGGVLLELIAFTKIFQPASSFASASMSLVGLATALLVMEIPLSKMAKMKFNELIHGLIGVGSALATFAVFTKMVRNESMFSMSIGLNIMAASLLTIAESFEAFKGMDTKQILASMGAMVSMLAMITVAGKVLDGAELDDFETSMLFMSVALVLIAKAMKQVSGLSFTDVASGLTALAGGLATMIIAAKMLANASLSKSIKELTLMSGALLLMSVSIKMLGAGGIVSAVSSIVGLAGTLIILSAAVRVMKPMIGTMMSLSGSIVAFSGSLVVLGAAAAVVGLGVSVFITSLAGSIALLMGMDPKQLVSGLVAVAGAFIAVGVAAKLLKGSEAALFSFAGTVASLGLSFLAVGLAISTVTGALTVLAAVGESGVKTIVSALTGLLTGIIGIIPKAINSIVEAGKALVLGLVDIIVSTAPEIADGIAKMLVEVLGSLNEYGPQIIDFLLTFMIKVIDGLTARVPELLTSLGNLLNAVFTTLMDALAKANPDALIKGVIAVGSIALLAKALAGLTALLPAAMKGLLAAGVLIAELSLVLAAIGGLAQIPGLDWLVSEGGNFLQTIGTAIGQFVGGIAGGFTEGLSNSFPQLGANLSKFMTNLQPFIEGAKSIDPSVGAGIASLAKAILVLTAADILDGITSWLTGGASIADFANDLPILGSGLSRFAASVDGLDPQKVIAAADAAKVLANMTNTIPNEGGVLAWFVGENSISKFASKLPELGTGLKGFSDAVVGINAENITAAASSAKALAQMCQYIPNEGGIKAWFTGESSISKFSKELKVLGEGFKGFSDSVAGINPENTLIASKAAKNIGSMLASLPADVSNITVLADNLKTFGGGLQGYFAKISEISAEKIESSNNVIKAIKDVCSVNTAPLKTITKNINDAAKALEKLMTTANGSVSKFSKALSTLGNTSVDSFLKSFKGLDTKVKNVATKAMNSFKSGVTEKNKSISSALKSVVSSCVSALRDYHKNFKSAGKYLVEGFAQGISANTYMAKAKASAMASAAYRSAKKTLDVNSPSKVFRKLGLTVPEGFAQGISRLGALVKNASSSMANTAINGSKNAMRSMSRLINSNIDVQPRITPVMDLSGLSSGINDINSMFGGNRTLGVTANVRSIQAAMSGIQNNQNEDVVNAIDKLRKDLNNVNTGDTYSINGVYANDDEIVGAIKSIVRAVKVERRA